MKHFLKLIAGLAILSFIITSCGNNTKKTVTTEDKVKEKGARVLVPNFNSDSAFYFTQKQVEFGPRVNNTVAHDKCAIWLEQKMKTYSSHVIVQKATVRAYNGTALKMKNIITSFNPDAPARILLCSHWDSRPYADQDKDSTKHRTAIDGANDGASGVGVLMEVARILMTNKLTVGVDILFFDAEDYGAPQDDKKQYAEDGWGLGSQYWAKNPHQQNYQANFGILLDMVGIPNPNFTHEGISVQYAPDVLNKVWDAASRIGFGGNFVEKQTNPITDDHYYINTLIKIPTIDIIHYDETSGSGFYKNWHTMQDNLANVDKNSLKLVGQTLLTVVFEESGQTAAK